MYVPRLFLVYSILNPSYNVTKTQYNMQFKCLISIKYKPTNKSIICVNCLLRNHCLLLQLCSGWSGGYGVIDVFSNQVLLSVVVTLRYLPLLPIIGVHRNHHWQTTSLSETQFSQSNNIIVKRGKIFLLSCALLNVQNWSV